MKTANQIIRLFQNSSKRILEFQKFIGECREHERRRRQKKSFRTPWVEQHDAFEVFADLWDIIVVTLEAIRGGGHSWSRDSK